MAIKAQKFQELLTVVKTLTFSQKAVLRKQLNDNSNRKKKLSNFTKLLLNGPVFTKKQIKIIEENKKDISINVKELYRSIDFS